MTLNSTYHARSESAAEPLSGLTIRGIHCSGITIGIAVLDTHSLLCIIQHDHVRTIHTGIGDNRTC